MTGTRTGRRCTVCTHSERPAIDRALVKGAPYRTIAARFALSKTALIRHREKHVPEALVQSQEAAEVAESDTLVREIRALKQDADRIRESAERAGDLRTALAGVRELARLIELQAEMLGELNRQTVVNILVNPQWITLRGAVLRALDPYPEARLAVAEALSDDDA